MRLTLPESSHRRQRSAGGTLLSAAIHAIAIGGMLVASGMAAEGARTPPTPPDLLLYLRKVPDPQPLVERTPTRSIVPPRDVRPPNEVPPPLPSTNVVIDPSVVPTGIPDIGQPLGAPFDSTSRGTSNVSASSGSPGGTGDVTLPMSALAVDREVVPLRGAVPRYPRMLSSANMEGTVVLQFVVDTLGRVEKESVKVLRADHAQFEQSVRDALDRMRFVPAEAGGRRVRQLVEQAFSFALTQRN